MSAAFNDNPLPPAKHVDVAEGDLHAKLNELKRGHFLIVSVTAAPLPAAGWRIWYQPVNVVLGLVG